MVVSRAILDLVHLRLILTLKRAFSIVICTTAGIFWGGSSPPPPYWIELHVQHLLLEYHDRLQCDY